MQLILHPSTSPLRAFPPAASPSIASNNPPMFRCWNVLDTTQTMQKSTVIVWSADLTVLHGNRTVYSDGDEFQSVDVYNGPQ